MRGDIPYPISVAILYYVGVGQDMEDTLEGVKAINDVLRKMGHMVRVREVKRNNWRNVTHIAGDVIFNLVEDEDYDLYMKVARRLEMAGRVQVGFDLEGLKYITSKTAVKRQMQRSGIPTPEFRIVKYKQKVRPVRGMEFPMIVKPSGQHAAIGIDQDAVVIDQQELDERVKYLFKYFRGEVVVEEFIEGMEVQVSVIGNGRKLTVLPPAQIEFGGEFANNWDVYTYQAKWDKQSWEYWAARVVCPAPVGKYLTRDIELTAIKLYKAFGCRDVARFDMRIDDKGKIYVVDVNLSPSLNELDDQDATVISARTAGWSYAQMIERIVAAAYKRSYGKMPDRIRERHFMLMAPEI